MTKSREKPIALYWSSGGTAASNYGDSLSAFIVERIFGRQVVFARPHNADLIAIGSVLNKGLTKTWKRYITFRHASLGIWGTGTGTDFTGNVPSFVHIASVRGPLTRDSLKLAANTPMGDPALLMRELLPVKGKLQTVGIVPHISEAESPYVKRLHSELPGSVIIDLRNPDLEFVTRQIASSDLVISSSLHGLIVADSYSIPNIKTSFGTALIGGCRKFLDYGASVGRYIDYAQPTENLSLFKARASCAEKENVSERIADCLAAAKSLNLT
jgi:hypothetical protein